MVFTSRIEVFRVKPDFHFSCVINSFHNDLFSKGLQRGLFYFHKRHSCIFGRTSVGNYVSWFGKLRKLTVNYVSWYGKLRKLTVNDVSWYGKLRKLTLNYVR